MAITSINRNSSVSPYQRLMAQDFTLGKISKSGFLPEVEPVSAIVGREKTQIVDKDDIDYKRVKQYEEKVFGRKNQEEPVLSALPKPRENNSGREVAVMQTPKENKSNERVDTSKENTNRVNDSKDNANRDNTSKANDSKAFASEQKSVNGKELTEAEKKIVQELKKIDQEVRTHEQAHMSAGSGLVRGGASYSYTQGPDGQRYATGGEVSIDMSPESDPAKTEAKMQQVIAAAMAPADPSPQDYSVAASASRIAAQARVEKMRPNEDDNTDAQKIEFEAVSSNNQTSKKVDVSEEDDVASDDVVINENVATKNVVATTSSRDDSIQNNNNINNNNTSNNTSRNSNININIIRADGKLRAYSNNQSNLDNNQTGRITNFVA